MKAKFSSSQPTSLFTQLSVLLLTVTYVGTIIWVQFGGNLLISFIVTIPLSLLALVFGVRAYKHIDKYAKKRESKILLLTNWLYAVFVLMNLAYLVGIVFVIYFGRQLVDLFGK